MGRSGRRIPRQISTTAVAPTSDPSGARQFGHLNRGGPSGGTVGGGYVGQCQRLRRRHYSRGTTAVLSQILLAPLARGLVALVGPGWGFGPDAAGFIGSALQMTAAESGGPRPLDEMDRADPSAGDLSTGGETARQALGRSGEDRDEVEDRSTGEATRDRVVPGGQG
jgi:hypothetical protein